MGRSDSREAVAGFPRSAHFAWTVQRQTLSDGPADADQPGSAVMRAGIVCHREKSSRYWTLNDVVGSAVARPEGTSPKRRIVAETPSPVTDCSPTSTGTGASCQTRRIVHARSGETIQASTPPAAAPASATRIEYRRSPTCVGSSTGPLALRHPQETAGRDRSTVDTVELAIRINPELMSPGWTLPRSTTNTCGLAASLGSVESSRRMRWTPESSGFVAGATTADSSTGSGAPRPSAQPALPSPTQAAAMQADTRGVVEVARTNGAYFNGGGGATQLKMNVKICRAAPH